MIANRDQVGFKPIVVTGSLVIMVEQRQPVGDSHPRRIGKRQGDLIPVEQVVPFPLQFNSKASAIRGSRVTWQDLPVENANGRVEVTFAAFAPNPQGKPIPVGGACPQHFKPSGYGLQLQKRASDAHIGSFRHFGFTVRPHVPAAANDAPALEDKPVRV